MTDDDEVEQVWQEFWVPLLYANGTLDLEQVKKELYDFKRVMDEVEKAYIHVTGGKFSKVLTPAEWIIQAADEHYREEWEWLNTPIETFKPE